VQDVEYMKKQTCKNCPHRIKRKKWKHYIHGWCNLTRRFCPENYKEYICLFRVQELKCESCVYLNDLMDECEAYVDNPLTCNQFEKRELK